MLNYFFRTAFAFTGDKAAVPEATQPDGSVSFNQGWSPDYQLPYSNPNSKNIPRDKSNQLMWLLTTALQEYQINGVPDWIDPSQNSGANYSYPNGARVRYSDGLIYRSMIAANNLLPSNTAGWQPERGVYIGTRVITATGTYTPTPGTKAVGVRIISGGGAGGGAAAAPAGQVSVGSGGNGGSYAEGYFTSGFSGVTVTIGAGGAPAFAANGGTGGSSSFGALISCPGGIGGQRAIAGANTSIGVTISGGVPTGGTVNTPYLNPNPVIASFNAGAIGGGLGAANTTFGSPGSGGVALTGGGAAASDGTAGRGFGAGGGGAAAAAGSGGATGGGGAPGLCLVDEYI